MRELVNPAIFFKLPVINYSRRKNDKPKEEFGTTLTAIHMKSSEVDTATTGKVAMKYQAEDDMIALLVPIASCLFVYAKKKGNAELMEKARVTEYVLRRIRDTELASRAETIAALAEENTANLIPANITSDMIADLKIQLDAYRNALGVRERSVAERKGARITMQDHFYKMDEILGEEIDPAMELIRASNAQFYNEYFALRVVKDTGVRHNKPEPAPAPAATWRRNSGQPPLCLRRYPLHK
jgi:hypothetical protein